MHTEREGRQRRRERNVERVNTRPQIFCLRPGSHASHTESSIVPSAEPQNKRHPICRQAVHVASGWMDWNER